MGYRDRAVIACVLACAPAVHADPSVTKQDTAADAPSPSLDASALLPSSAVPQQGVIATSTAGYAGAPALSESIAATLGRFTIHADAGTLGNSPQWRTELGASFGVLRSRLLDLDVGGGYEPIGWSGVPEVVTRVAAGRAIAGGRVQATAALGVGTDRSESYGDFDLAANHPVGAGVFAGVDSRLRLDLAQDPDDSPTERQWDARLAAFASRAFGRFAVIACAGVVSWKLRFGVDQTGAIGTLGVASAF